MALFDRLISNFGASTPDVIQWGPDTDYSVFVHKHGHEGFPDHSKLLVGPNQGAILTNGTDILVFTEPGAVHLESGDSMFAPFRTGAGKRGSLFHAGVYFVDASGLKEQKWGMPTPLSVHLPV